MEWHVFLSLRKPCNLQYNETEVNTGMGNLLKAIFLTNKSYNNGGGEERIFGMLFTNFGVVLRGV